MSISNDFLNILISQPPPLSSNPYLFLEQKYNVGLTFLPFVRVEPLSYKELKKQNIDLSKFTAVYFTSKVGIDAFFQYSEKERFAGIQNLKYFCISESLAFYLQKYIVFRKRKVLYSSTGKFQEEFQHLLLKNKSENFLLVLSEQKSSDVELYLKKAKFTFTKSVFYKSINADFKDDLSLQDHNLLAFFTPQAIRSLLENFPNFSQEGKVIAVYGASTLKAAKEFGLKVDIECPTEKFPTMYNALDNFLANQLRSEV